METYGVEVEQEVFEWWVDKSLAHVHHEVLYPVQQIVKGEESALGLHVGVPGTHKAPLQTDSRS